MSRDDDAPVATALQARIQKTLDEFLAENGGGFTSGWLFLLDYVDSSGEEAWSFSVQDGQRMMRTIGLARFVGKIADGHVEEYLSRDDE